MMTKTHRTLNLTYHVSVEPDLLSSTEKKLAVNRQGLKMIGNQYKAHKDNIIDLFNGYKEKRGDLNDGVDIDFLESRIESLKNGKYTLAVAGEVKAGKSTFINALLGAEILPSDVLQASSAIVEIFKSEEKSFLRVKYADGREEEIYDDSSKSDIDEAREKLHEICRILDEYREIPTTLIDEYIIKSSASLEVTESLIQEWRGQSGVNLSGKEDLLEQYISERTKDSIPVEINFGYPLEWDFDELRIVDSPGVNASGGVQDVSFQFFEDANAILFVHPIKPVESVSFRKFITSVISNRSKETLFLVLTHAGERTDSEIERLHSEAVRLYKDDIPEERILVVDSLLKLIHNDLEGGKTLEQIEESSEQKSDILAKFEKKAKRQKRELKDVVLEGSRFEKMFEAINEFSMQAPNLQLQEILESIKRGYEDQDNQYKKKLELLGKKKSNPQEFEAEIDRINTALKKYKLLMNDTKEDLISNYTGKNSEWIETIEELKAFYPELIKKSNTLALARKNLTDAINDIECVINAFSSALTIQLNEMLEAMGKTFQEEHKITVPKVDLKSIEKKTKDEAYKTECETKTESVWKSWNWLKFKWTKKSRSYETEKEVYDPEQHLSLFRGQCHEEFYSLVNELPSKSKEVLNLYTESFNKKMIAAIEERQQALENEKEKKQSNDEIISEIGKLERKKKEIQPELKRAEEILEDIK